MPRTAWNSRAGLLASAADDFVEAKRCIRRAKNWRQWRRYRTADEVARLAMYARILNTRALATRRRALSMAPAGVFTVAS